MNDKKGHLPSKYLLLLLGLICVALALLSSLDVFSDTSAGKIAGTIVSPVQKAFTSAGNWISDRFSFLEDKEELINENKRLQEKVDELTLENTTLKSNSFELDRLRKLYELDAQYAEYPKVAATVIGKDPGNWFQDFIIDKGSEDGIETDMNVIASGGLVGRIAEVGSHWARVVSIIDDASNVSAMTQTTGDYCVVSGDLEMFTEGEISMTKLYDSNDDVAVGEMLVTSNISEVFLPGLLIGSITDLSLDANQTTKSGKVSLVVDFEHIREVFVITQKK